MWRELTGFELCREILYSFCDFWAVFFESSCRAHFMWPKANALILLSSSLKASVRVKGLSVWLMSISLLVSLVATLGTRNLVFQNAGKCQHAKALLASTARESVKLAEYKFGFPFAIVVAGFITWLWTVSCNRPCSIILPTTCTFCFRTLQSAWHFQNYRRELCRN